MIVGVLVLAIGVAMGFLLACLDYKRWCKEKAKKKHLPDWKGCYWLDDYKKRLEKKNTAGWIGCYWLDDDSFSTGPISGRKIKAVVEYMDDDFIYGDLTASEVFHIEEQLLTWEEAEKFFAEFSYPCKKDEKIVWYNVRQLQKVQETYEALDVPDTLLKLGKPFRDKNNWTCTEAFTLGKTAYCVNFRDGEIDDIRKGAKCYVRPVIAMRNPFK